MTMLPVELLTPHRQFVAIDVPAFADGAPVLLVIDPQDSTVRAVSPDLARELWQAGLLRGWTPA